MIVRICIGSSCYLKGSSKITECLQEAVKEHQLEQDVTLVGSFCVGKCSLEGVTVLDWTDDYVRHDDSVGMFGNWNPSGRRANKGEKWELPYSCLYGSKIKNLATAGRCLSATGDMWDITRVIPVCSLSGEAAGTAAALGKNFAEVDIRKLQAKLQENGVMLHWEE